MRALVELASLDQVEDFANGLLAVVEDWRVGGPDGLLLSVDWGSEGTQVTVSYRRAPLVVEESDLHDLSFLDADPQADSLPDLVRAVVEDQNSGAADVAAVEGCDGGRSAPEAPSESPVEEVPRVSEPGSASALAASTRVGLLRRTPDVAVAPAPAPVVSDKPARWTEDDDARLVAMVAKAVAAGQPKGSAYQAAALVLGRPLEGLKFRCAKTLRDRITTKVAELQGAALTLRREPVVRDPMPAARPEVAPVVVGPVAAPVSQAIRPTVAAQAVSDALADHLDKVDRSFWTEAKDIKLLTGALEGLGREDIAADLAVPVALIRARLDVLTGHWRDEATGTFKRRYTNSMVLAALVARRDGVAGDAA